MNEKIPKVSFLIATYNRVDFLVNCIDSILSQTYKNFEIIIVDDGSTDSTEDIIREKYGTKVIYRRNPFNRGVAFARNMALTYASGEYIGLLDSDDVLLTDSFLDTALKILESENADIFCCDNYRIDEKNQRIGAKTFFQATIDHRGLKLLSGIKDFDYIFFHGIHSCGMLIRKALIDKAGFLDVDYKIAWDEDFFLRFALNPKHRIYYYNEPLTGYRIHNGNISGNFSQLYKEKIACRLNIVKRNKELKKRLGVKIKKRLASQYFCLADAYKKEKKFFQSALSVLHIIVIHPPYVIDLIRHVISKRKKRVPLVLKAMFNKSSLKIRSLLERNSDLDISAISNLDGAVNTGSYKEFKEIAGYIIKARKKSASIILMMGGHVIRSGVQKYLIDLMERGFISCIAMNGSGMIHDFEFALIGATTENVARYIKEGQFGLWKETAQLNDIINEAYMKDKNIGMGEAVGSYMERSNLPHKSISILACASRLRIPVTIHVGIGYDIIHEHPNCNGAATGALSYNDFLKFASVVQNLEHGVVMNFGSSVMGPEVFLKALSMVRNVARSQGKEVKHFTTLVCDLIKLPEDIEKEPSCEEPQYYFRPWKTMLVRTIADGGKGFYFRGRHAQTIPALWGNINKLEAGNGKGN